MKTTMLSLVLGIGSLLPPLARCAVPVIQFGPVTHYTKAVGYGNGICGGDFNGDGQLELVTAGPQGITLWTNDGAGGFAGKGNSPALGPAFAVATGDLNRDGKPDLLTANENSLSAFLCQGDNNFSRVDTLLSVNSDSPDLALGDFNHDGILDVAMAAYRIDILLGHGDGTLTLFTNYPGIGPLAAAPADLNGDQNLDLVTASGWYFGSGDGQFAAVTDYSGVLYDTHYEIATGDFNRDSRPDLATVNFYNSSVSVRLSNGDGTFGSETRYPGIIGAHSLATGDFNLDGNLDLVAGQASAAHALAVLPGKGDGTFETALTNFTGLSSSYHQLIAVGDFDNDGLVDLATTIRAASVVSVYLNQSVALLKAERLSAGVRLSWPNWPGYLLEGSTNLLQSNDWFILPDTPALVGNRKILTNAMTNDRQFYRLHKPAP